MAPDQRNEKFTAWVPFPWCNRGVSLLSVLHRPHIIADVVVDRR